MSIWVPGVVSRLRVNVASDSSSPFALSRWSPGHFTVNVALSRRLLTAGIWQTTNTAMMIP